MKAVVAVLCLVVAVSCVHAIDHARLRALRDGPVKGKGGAVGPKQQTTGATVIAPNKAKYESCKAPNGAAGVCLWPQYCPKAKGLTWNKVAVTAAGGGGCPNKNQGCCVGPASALPPVPPLQPPAPISPTPTPTPTPAPAVDAAKTVGDNCHQQSGWANAINCLLKTKDANGVPCRYAFGWSKCVSVSDKCGVSLFTFPDGDCRGIMSSGDVAGNNQVGAAGNPGGWCRALQQGEYQRCHATKTGVPTDMCSYPLLYQNQGCK